MNISDEVMEAANRAVYRGFKGLIRPLLVKVVLESAAPYMAAQTLREASDAYPIETAYGGAEHAILWLKERADALEAEQ